MFLFLFPWKLEFNTFYRCFLFQSFIFTLYVRFCLFFPPSLSLSLHPSRFSFCSVHCLFFPLFQLLFSHSILHEYPSLPLSILQSLYQTHLAQLFTRHECLFWKGVVITCPGHDCASAVCLWKRDGSASVQSLRVTQAAQSSRMVAKTFARTKGRKW